MTILSQIGDSCRQLYGDLGEAMLTLISRVGNVGVVERKVAHFLLGDLVEYRKIGPDGWLGEWQEKEPATLDIRGHPGTL